ncbi:hypothetical protein SRA_06651 [Streptococcus ratti FA-1 = DSM 20564]|uniref:Uncharacterized protein n=1 Tax=Streptococcus ratti FA-1 = DSM 20564 TaxID=699248 RepID=A0ABN0GV76_STRRT|nr:hypothetical protein SRA_06651 [Streptococcus ratti FA-1 = DSM 20564]
MILTEQIVTIANNGFTRTRGGDPNVSDKTAYIYEFYPHTRG